MEEINENTYERLKQKLSKLEKVWTAMKTSKSSSEVSCITVEEALELVENSPSKLMISLQHYQACPESEAELRSPYRRELFHNSDVADDDHDDDTRATTFSHSTCWSSNVMRDGDNIKINQKHEKKNRGSIVFVSVVFLLLWFLVVMNGFDQHSMSRQINTLDPT